ncbi:hypothetical protein F5972_02545 [Microbispora cellulosiformans]|uniref:Uncharacterized protein n=1 Tax=Microbispora cellulosiformans TaxID=2614688 RepID=A0A5J5K9P3_9ACTN|nr:YwqJ-related putative deaminase [Microbispora cellulosiformans]KAA9381721.1 hypothetical protein F5972_02545 [Microbispora cellulosiformans]
MAETTHTSHNPAEEAVPTTKVKEWASAARVELGQWLRTATLASETKAAAEEVWKRLGALESALVNKTKSEAEARAAFVTWVYESDWNGGFTWYLEEKARVVAEARRLEAEQAIQRFIAKARTEAQKATRTQGGVGTVVAGLADLGTQQTFTGTSGAYPNLPGSGKHPVMEEILSRVGQGEDWTVDNCAEVDAMNKYLYAINARVLSDVQGKNLYFHAETWNWDKKVWQPRKACGNCDKWLKTIGARRV